MLNFFTGLFRRTSKRARFNQNDTETLDNETLLPPSSRPFLTVEPSSCPKFEYQVALKTLIVCSVVYLSAGFWIAYGVRKAEFVEDADEFCINHVSQYCESRAFSRERSHSLVAAPIVRDVAPAWHTQQFNGSFLHANVYRQSAGPEVDAAWDALGVNCKMPCLLL